MKLLNVVADKFPREGKTVPMAHFPELVRSKDDPSSEAITKPSYC